MNNRTAEFENILDECLTGLLTEQTTMEDCLIKYPEHASALRGMLETAAGVKQAVAVQPRAEFKERARREFAQALVEAKPKKSFFNLPFSFGLQPVWAAALSIAIVFLLSSGGTTALAQTSMPGSILYALKLTSENVRLSLTFSNINKAEVHSVLADRRVAEIAYLAAKGDADGIDKASVALNMHLYNISVLAAPQAVATILTAPTTPQVERAFAPEAVTMPTTPTPAAPPSPAAEAPQTEEGETPEVSMSQLAPPETEPEAAMKSAADSSAAASVPAGDSRSELSIRVASQAGANAARLRALLATAPETVRPALLRAIEIMEAGYASAADSLNR